MTDYAKMSISIHCHNFYLFLLEMHIDIIKLWSSFSIHQHNRTRTLSIGALRGMECVTGSDYLPEKNAA